jgi:hypothetical protein
MNAVRKSYLQHSHGDAESCQKALLSLSAPAPRSQRPQQVASLATLMAITNGSAPTTRDLVLFGGISTITSLLLLDHEVLIVGALALISRICDLAVTWHAAVCFVDADVLGHIGNLLLSKSSQVRKSAASTMQRLVTSFGRALVKDCANVLKICKSLVDIIQLDSWNDENAASGALWALAGLQYDEGKMTAALEEWGDRYFDDEASDLVGDAAGEDADEEEFSDSDVEMDVDPSQVSTTGPLRDASITNAC